VLDGFSVIDRPDRGGGRLALSQAFADVPVAALRATLNP
jgi:hypothetical protein